jgi:hypothetical protein
MLTYNEYDFIKSDFFADIIHFLGGETPDDSEVWEIARESKEIPIFENIWYMLAVSEIERCISEKYELFYQRGEIKIDCFINCMDTHLIINGVWLNDFEEFEELINKITGEVEV